MVTFHLRHSIPQSGLRTDNMVHVYHASDSDSDDAEGLEFGNVQLAQSFGQMPLDQSAAAAGVRPPGGAGSQHLAGLDISSLPDWDPQAAASAMNGGGRAAHSSGTAPPPAGSRVYATEDANGSAAAQRPLSTPPSSAWRSHTATDRLLSQSEYVRKNSVMPPPLPAPPDWLRDRLGGESLTEQYLRGAGQPSSHPQPRLQPPPAAPPRSQSAFQQQALPNGTMRAGDGVRAPPALPPAAPGAKGRAPGAKARAAAAEATAFRAQLFAEVQPANSSGGVDIGAGGRPVPSALHHELQRFAAQVG